MLRIVNGDVLKAKEKYVIHQVNCQGEMRSGVAKQIREQYPIVYEMYKKLCDAHEETSELLGMSQYVVIDESRTVINLFGQDNFGRERRQTNYIEFIRSMLNIMEVVKGDIALPYKIGCDRGGANWSMIENLLRMLAEDFPYDIVLYEYND